MPSTVTKSMEDYVWVYFDCLSFLSQSKEERLDVPNRKMPVVTESALRASHSRSEKGMDPTRLEVDRPPALATLTHSRCDDGIEA